MKTIPIIGENTQNLMKTLIRNANFRIRGQFFPISLNFFTQMISLKQTFFFTF